jgi:V/A-type H+-transporting ATPase subunit D
MELMRLRKRMGIAQKGHKLLRDKQEELWRRFMALVDKSKKLRQEVEEGLIKAFGLFLEARSAIPEKLLEAVLSYPKGELTVESGTEKILNIRVPIFNMTNTPETDCYGFLCTPSSLDNSLQILKDTLPKMMAVAQIEETISILATEIEKTRRRVNALEFVLIPALTDTIKYIGQKLAEIERSNLTRLMRVKEIVRSH